MKEVMEGVGSNNGKRGDICEFYLSEKRRMLS